MVGCPAEGFDNELLRIATNTMEPLNEILDSAVEEPTMPVGPADPDVPDVFDSQVIDGNSWIIYQSMSSCPLSQCFFNDFDEDF